MTKIKMTLLTAIIALAGISQAAVLDFNDSSDIVSSKTWVAGSESTGKWYGSNYSIEDGQVNLDKSVGLLTNLFTDRGTSSVLYSVSLADVTPGTYSWSIETRYSSFLTQENYGQVYLLKNGQSIKLEGDIWNRKPAGAAIVSADYPGLFSGGEQWRTFGETFSLTASQLSTYDVVAFVFTGNRSNGQMLNYDNFSSDLIQTANVPEPATVALIASGALLTLLRKK
ncbi:MAG: PEP-CTERM sorting domain-containing protein [Sedimentisphaerales bacterium]|nr:PEP-CTERM sorting domain-containing protein [Sedimentisphaerales bacterium]